MRKLKFSIIIPSYNQGSFIEQTLLSVIQQDYKNYELIVIDGGSLDGTVEIIRKYDKYLTYWVSEPDKGQSEAIQKGFSRASGEILCWLNSDDVFMPGTLRSVNQAFIKSSADVVYGNKFLIDENGAIVSYRLVTPFLPLFIRDAYLCGGFGIYQPASFWTRALYMRCGGIDQSLRFCMDNDLFNKFVLSAAKFTFLDRFLAGFRIHCASKTATLNHIAEAERKLLTAKYVTGPGVKYSSLKRMFARLYRLGWFVMKGRAHKILYTRFFDRYKWVP